MITKNNNIILFIYSKNELIIRELLISRISGSRENRETKHTGKCIPTLVHSTLIQWVF